MAADHFLENARPVPAVAASCQRLHGVGAGLVEAQRNPANWWRSQVHLAQGERCRVALAPTGLQLSRSPVSMVSHLDQ